MIDRMKVSSLFWWCESLSFGGHTFGEQYIRSRLAVLISSNSMCDLGDDVWWPLVVVTHWETVIHHFLFFVGKLPIWFSYAFTDAPLAFDIFCHSWKSSAGLLDGCVSGTWLGLIPWRGAALPVSGPLGHSANFLKL